MSNKITFSQLIEELSEQTNTSQSFSNDFVSHLTDLVIETSVNTGKASITNFGNFKVVDVAARNGVNPQTGEPIVIPTHQRLSFTPYKSLENKVNALYANLEATFIEEEEEEVPRPIFKNPKKNSNSSQTTPIMLAIVFVLLVVVAGVWFFVFRDSNTSSIAEKSPNSVEQPVETIVPVETPTPASEVEESAVQPAIAESTVTELPVETNLVVNAPLGISSHIVSKDEWFYDIARDTYKTPTFWPLIFEANFSASEDPDILKPGKILNIPSIENPLNPTAEDRKRLSRAAQVVSEAYANVGKADKAFAYEQMAKRF